MILDLFKLSCAEGDEGVVLRLQLLERVHESLDLVILRLKRQGLLADLSLQSVDHLNSFALNVVGIVSGHA